MNRPPKNKKQGRTIWQLATIGFQQMAKLTPEEKARGVELVRAWVKSNDENMAAKNPIVMPAVAAKINKMPVELWCAYAVQEFPERFDTTPKQTKPLTGSILNA